MAMFIEVFDKDKNCDVIINLDEVMEIAPRFRIEDNKPVDDGCELSFPDAASVGGKRAMKVRNTYVEFKQFAIKPVSAEDIAKVNGRISKDIKKEKAPVEFDIPKL